MTTWKAIEGYANYSVSDNGQVRNDKTGKILSPALDSNGYRFVLLCKNGEQKHGYIHRLVAEAFIPNPDNLRDVNHRDGNKQNNRKSNLEWRTHAENIIYSITWFGKPRSTRAKKAVQCVETGLVYSSVQEAAKAVGRSPTAIRKCIEGWTNTCAGLHWRCLYDCENGSDPRGESYDLWLCKTRWEEYFGVPEEQSVV